jgi:hypothetical protein
LEHIEATWLEEGHEFSLASLRLVCKPLASKWLSAWQAAHTSWESHGQLSGVKMFNYVPQYYVGVQFRRVLHCYPGNDDVWSMADMVAKVKFLLSLHDPCQVMLSQTLAPYTIVASSARQVATELIQLCYDRDNHIALAIVLAKLNVGSGPDMDALLEMPAPLPTQRFPSKCYESIWNARIRLGQLYNAQLTTFNAMLAQCARGNSGHVHVAAVCPDTGLKVCIWHFGQRANFLGPFKSWNSTPLVYWMTRNCQSSDDYALAAQWAMHFANEEYGPGSESKLSEVTIWILDHMPVVRENLLDWLFGTRIVHAVLKNVDPATLSERLCDEFHFNNLARLQVLRRLAALIPMDIPLRWRIRMINSDYTLDDRQMNKQVSALIHGSLDSLADFDRVSEALSLELLVESIDHLAPAKHLVEYLFTACHNSAPMQYKHIGVAKLIELCNADPLRKVQLSVWAKARSLATMQLISELTADIKRDAQKVIGFVAFLSSI